MWGRVRSLRREVNNPVGCLVLGEPLRQSSRGVLIDAEVDVRWQSAHVDGHGASDCCTVISTDRTPPTWTCGQG